MTERVLDELIRENCAGVVRGRSGLGDAACANSFAQRKLVPDLIYAVKNTTRRRFQLDLKVGAMPNEEYKTFVSHILRYNVRSREGRCLTSDFAL